MTYILYILPKPCLSSLSVGRIQAPRCLTLLKSASLTASDMSSVNCDSPAAWKLPEIQWSWRVFRWCHVALSDRVRHTMVYTVYTSIYRYTPSWPLYASLWENGDFLLWWIRFWGHFIASFSDKAMSNWGGNQSETQGFAGDQQLSFLLGQAVAP